jgi:hypothetical protein
MSNDSRKTVEELLGPMLKKRLFVAISRAATSASAIKPFVAEHLAYMNALEAEGAFGPPARSSRKASSSGTGLTVLSTSTIEEARQAMEAEPLIKRGLRTVVFRKWEVREGRIDISLRASVSRYSL